MTATQILVLAATQDIVLAAQGDRLVVDAPTGALTPELRSELVRHKPALLALLTAPRAFVTLRQGPTLPVEAIELAIDLERRGFRLSVDAWKQFQIEPTSPLTDIDLTAVSRWRLHLAAIVSHDTNGHGRPQ